MKHALHISATKVGMTTERLLKCPPGRRRRSMVDDITIGK